MMYHAYQSAKYNPRRGTDFKLNVQRTISRTNVASVGSVFNDTRKVKVLLLPETIKEKSTFRGVQDGWFDL